MTGKERSLQLQQLQQQQNADSSFVCIHDSSQSGVYATYFNGTRSPNYTLKV